MENTKLKHDCNDVVILELDRPRELRLGHKALKRFSALTNCSMADMEQEIQRYDKLSCLLWVMVTQDQIDHDEDMMTPEQLDDLLDAVPIPKLTKLCSMAIEAAFVDEDAEKAGEADPPQAAGTGTGA